jgi:hypothetical protein
MVADFWDSIEEAERVRTLSLLGLHELTQALKREEADLGVKHDDNNLDPAIARRLQAAWERAEWASAELANDSPHGNAQALISMNSALDAMVEELVKVWREVHVDHLTREFVKKAMEAEPTAIAQLRPHGRDALDRTIHAEIDRRVPKALRPKGSGIERYEKPLRRLGWAAPPDRPIPTDLDAALTELGALRDVLVHRAGRLDEKALEQAPTLRYRVGQLVRVSRNDYRTYSAAIRCYAHEVNYRGIRNWPEVTDEKDGPNLAGWRGYVRVNA